MRRIDVVIHQSAIARTFPFSRECRAAGIPVVAVFHQPLDAWRTKFEGKTPLFRRFRLWRKGLHARMNYRKICRESAAVLMLSGGERDALLRCLPKNSGYANKIYVLPNMVPLGEGVPAEEISRKRKELLFVGRIELGQKRPDLLLKIWAKLEARFPEWSLRMVGGGDKNDMLLLKTLAGTLGLARVSFEGFQKPGPYYREASIFCMTSAYEGFGLVLVEAASFGCVPVAFDSYAAVRDIIDDGENGALVPAFDLDAYAETLARLMLDDALRERLAKNALAQIPAKFSPEKIGAQWEALFRKVCMTRSRGASSAERSLNSSDRNTKRT